ncbi:MAG: DUF4982 domain-containing protein [Clostridia bacterium]|nr:DUF4982 domain-containing protein [Clostridia bacterium]
MRKYINMNADWLFTKPENESIAVNVPHTWNNLDGQDGGDDYWRGTCTYEKRFAAPERGADERVFLEFKGVNSSCKVILNGVEVASHDGGYSTFRAEITEQIQEENTLILEVDNSKTEKVYPQTADFTFYGGIYRDVNLVIVPEKHFDLSFYGAPGIKVDATVVGSDGTVAVTGYANGGEIAVEIYDGDTLVAEGKSGETLTVANAKLWDGIKAPNLYKAVAKLYEGGELLDEVSANFGFRTYAIDTKKGFILNGRPYPLRGVCRHQDRKAIGNAITRAEHEEDMQLILETGANTVRLAHYQHDDYFYDLCDKYGLVVWAEIPYISRHMPEANENTVSQMKELIYQQYNHASIVCWGVSNEITMFHRHTKDMLAQHKILNDLCHEIDPARFTVLACYAMCAPFNRVGKITDAVSWNLYLGWYVPGLFLNKVWYWFYRLLNGKRVFGMSEYGAEGMPNLHAVKPKRGDNTEEYQFIYHEYMLKFFEKHPEFWATHLWNCFDFAADARDQGGEPGMNHKGLITFDRKIKKDSFYLYKAYWSEDPFVHLCGKRFVNRTGNKLEITVCSNQPEVEVLVNGKSLGTKKGSKVFRFTTTMEAKNEIEVRAGALTDAGTVIKVEKPDPAYILKKTNTKNWQK